MKWQAILTSVVACLFYSLSYSQNPDLHALIKAGDVVAVERALETNPSLDVLDDFNRSLMQNALLANNTDIVELLLSKGFDANAKARGFKKRPLFHIAVEKGNLDAVRMLLDAGADPNATDARGQTGIDYGIVHYEAPIVHLLLQRGAQLPDKEDPLMSAITNADREMVVLLMSSGAQYSQKGLVESQCARCHGLDGRSHHRFIGHLEGQHLDYLTKQLYDFRSGRRESIRGRRMNKIMHAMTDEMIELTASYYSELPKVERVYDQSDFDQATIELGRSLYQEGDPQLNIPACKSCHGMPDTSTDSTLIPKIYGLNIDVVVSQLERFKKGLRNNDEDGVMRTVAAPLSEDQITALSQYIWTLGAVEPAK